MQFKYITKSNNTRNDTGTNLNSFVSESSIKNTKTHKKRPSGVMCRRTSPIATSH